MSFKEPILNTEAQELLLDQKGRSMIFISVILWKLDFYSISDDMLKLVRALDGVDNDEIFKTKAV